MGDIRQELRVLLQSMIVVAAADGHLDDSEAKLIRDVYRRLVGSDLDGRELANAVAELQGDGSRGFDALLAATGREMSEAAKQRVLKAACLIMVADGRISAAETERLAEFAAILEYPEDEFAAVVREYF
jgi:tellurite resistance protein